MSSEPLIAVYLVTYRRHGMLRRSLKSALDQTYRNIVVRVVNDDPSDTLVNAIVEEAQDPRACLFKPLEKRGGTRNFNLMLREKEASYVSLLEDDNWWEPAFLDSMYGALQKHPEFPVVVGNELIWRELPGDQWKCTDQTIWSFRDIRPYIYTLESICGSAKICNSSMLFRLPDASGFLTPESIPVDVTEHFRERLLPTAILLNGAPLVNYAETLQTARKKGGEWSMFQYILVGSAFRALQDEPKRIRLAKSLWSECPSATCPRAVTLVSTGFAISEARPLIKYAPALAILRTAAWIARRPGNLSLITKARRKLISELEFLTQAPLTRQLAALFSC